MCYVFVIADWFQSTYQMWRAQFLTDSLPESRPKPWKQLENNKRLCVRRFYNEYKGSKSIKDSSTGEGEVIQQDGFQEKVGLGKGPEEREWVQEQKACSRWWGSNRWVGLTRQLG